MDRRMLIAAALLSCNSGNSQLEDAGKDVVNPSCCSPILQSGCSSTEKCVLSATGCANKVECVPDGLVALGATCEADPVDTCQRGAMCSNGVCRGFCSALQDACEVGLCPPPSGDIHVCSEPCDPQNSSCPVGTECYLPLDSTGETPGCLPIGTRNEGDECEYPNECGSGLTCSRESSQPIGVCRQRCLTTQASCSSGYVCRERHALDGYGVCRP
jgi:hypothetical protein